MKHLQSLKVSLIIILPLFLLSCGGGLDCKKAEKGFQVCSNQFPSFDASSYLTNFKSLCEEANKKSYTETFKTEVECLVNYENASASKKPDCSTQDKLLDALAIRLTGTTPDTSCKTFYY